MDTFTLANQQRTPIRARPNEHGVYGQQSNFGSAIDVLNPFNPGQIRASARMPASTGGGNQSRSAFARAMADTNRTDIQNKFSQAGQEYQQKAQELRAQDVASRRDNANQRYGLGQEKMIRMKQQDTQLQQRLADFENKRQIAIKDQRANTLGNMARAAMAVYMVGAHPITGISTMGGGWAAPSLMGGQSAAGHAMPYAPNPHGGFFDGMSFDSLGRNLGQGALLTGALLG